MKSTDSRSAIDTGGHVVLVGLMGSGKSTVGRALATHLGLELLDTDDLVVERAGATIPEIFAREGEAAFRDHEREAIEIAVGTAPAVIACGGGAVLEESNRTRLRACGTVLWLHAPASVLAHRLGDGGGRPLLDGAPVEDRLAVLEAQRRSHYAETAHQVLDASRPIADVVSQAAAVVCADSDPETVVVRVDDAAHPHSIVVGPAAFEALAQRVGSRRRVALVTQPAMRHVADGLRARIDAAGPVADVFEIGEGESAKTLATVSRLTGDWARWGLLRDDAVVAVGGGVVGDVTGFAAATYHRGVDVAQVPTTLLAMVDAAIGGKTAVNLDEAKNLVGAFHMPIGVYADPAVLETLPDAAFRSGLGEVAKYALLGDRALERICCERSDAIARRDPAVLAEVVHRCAAAKAAIVAADPIEQTGTRAVLNLGHTLAHALETVAGYALSHGEAVAVGLVFAAELAAAIERISPQEAERHRALVVGVGLDPSAPPGLRGQDLRAVMRRDKKAAGGLTFMLPGPEGVGRVDDPDDRAVDAALAAIGVDP